MSHPTPRTCVWLAACGLLPGLALVAATDALAQSGFPIRPIRMVVPFAPAGSADNLARVVQQPLSEALGQNVVLDNRPGGSSTIGADLVAKALPDGHTLLFTTTTHTVNASLIPKLPFDPLKDFTAISLIVSQPNVLVVHPTVPVRTVKELVALAKAKPESLTYASGGNGSSPHLSGELLNLIAGTRITHVPYKSSGPAVTDLLGGHVKIMFAGPLAIEQYIKAGRLRPIAIADRKRSPAMPDLPTMTEAGFAGVETGTWYGMLGPANMPRPVLDAIYAAIQKTMSLPDVKARLERQGVDIVASAPRDFDQFMREETAKWAKLVKASGIKSG
jgi:tripartite-type tricarboxylate transporter receptor subunit TctC